MQNSILKKLLKKYYFFIDIQLNAFIITTTNAKVQSDNIPTLCYLTLIR